MMGRCLGRRVPPLSRQLSCKPPSYSLLPKCPLAFSLLDLLQQGLDVAWQGLPQGILVEPLEVPTDAKQEITV
jgi:hypothetical protein